MAVERIRIRRDTAANWTSANPTLGLGEMGIETDSGRIKVGDGSTAWISLDYAYAKADQVRSVSADYTITGAGDDNIVNVTTAATDRTITLPAGSGMEAGDLLEVHKVDSGTGKVVVSRAGSDTIDGVTSIDIDSQYDYARLRWSGSYWSLVEYKDHGSNTNGEWVRYADGSMEVFNDLTISGYPTTWPLPVSFVATPRRNLSGAKTNNVTVQEQALVMPTSASAADVYVLNVSTSAQTTSGTVQVHTTGRWRA